MVMSTFASHLPLNISDTIRDRGLVSKDHQYLLVTCVVMDFSRLSLYCPYPMAFQ